MTEQGIEVLEQRVAVAEAAIEGIIDRIRRENTRTPPGVGSSILDGKRHEGAHEGAIMASAQSTALCLAYLLECAERYFEKTPGADREAARQRREATEEVSKLHKRAASARAAAEHAKAEADRCLSEALEAERNADALIAAVALDLAPRTKAVVGLYSDIADNPPDADAGLGS